MPNKQGRILRTGSISTDDYLVGCGATRYTAAVIKSFRHKGVERFFRTGSKAGIQAAHASRLGRQLAFLNCAKAPADMNIPGWNLHPLKGKLENHWSVSVSGNWRLTFMFEDGDAVLVDYQDYH
jgi:proteic killer suppression protein